MELSSYLLNLYVKGFLSHKIRRIEVPSIMSVFLKKLDIHKKLTEKQYHKMIPHITILKPRLV